MRNLLVVLHRWIALIFGAVIVVVAVTGSLIVIEGPIDRALNPGLFSTAIPATGPVRLSLDSLLASARSRGMIGGISLPEGEGHAVVATTLSNGGEVFVSPYTGQVLGSRTRAQRRASFTSRNHALHVSLMAKVMGTQLVMWSTIAGLFLTLGGIYLWWQDKIWRVRLSGSWKRINFDLHHATGLLTFAVLFLMTATGIIMHYPILGRALDKLDGSSVEPPPSRQSAPVAGTPAVPIEAAARAALATLPGSELRQISIPADSTRPFTFDLRFPEDRTPGGRSRVAVDRWTGAVLSVRNSRAAGVGTKLNNLQRPLHTGDILGAPTRAIWFAASLIMASQALTGFLMWWNARPARKAAALRKKSV